MVGFDTGNANQSIAAFLVSRPPYAWIGFGWESDDRNWNDLFYLQVGAQMGGECLASWLLSGIGTSGALYA
jgi:hypothetical protein